MNKNDERVLVIPAVRFQEAGEFNGFRPFDEQYVEKLLDPQFLSYRRRGDVETEPSFKQLIPYVVLKHGDLVFHYTRGSGGGEARLRMQKSVGIGGHICDKDGPRDDSPYRNGMLRELSEEVEIGRYSESHLGFIYDPSTSVGQVHLGIVHVLELEEPKARPLEAAIHDARFSSLGELKRQAAEFETWSQLVIEQLGLQPRRGGSQ